MKKAGKYMAGALSLLYAAAVFLFFGFRYPYHIHYQEQYQLFEWTAGYFAEVVSSPGGFADYIGRMLVQFFYYARIGAAIYAILLVSLQLLFYKLLCSCDIARCGGKRADLLKFVISFIPPILLTSFLCDENSLVGAVVSLLIPMSCALLLARIPSGRVHFSAALCLVPALYWLCGPLSIVYVLLLVRREPLAVVAFSSALFIVCVVLLRFLCGFPLFGLLAGVHYYRFPGVMQLTLWVPALSVPFFCIISSFIHPNAESKLPTVVACALIPVEIILGSTTVSLFADFDKEEQMKYEFMVRYNMWNRILTEADRELPHTPMAVAGLNLALSATHIIGERMFHYYQNGPEGLLPSFVRDFTSPLPTAEAYWMLGMVNTAQRFTFEAQEAIPDFQKSARCFRRLAETNIVNGDYAVAMKYLVALTHTVFYRKWALDRMQLLWNDDAVEKDPVYGVKRRFRLKDHDFLFSDKEMVSMLGLLYVESGDAVNLAARDYLLAWCLLGKNLDRFMECFSLMSFDKVPKSYQEALVLDWSSSHTDFSGLPGCISPTVVARMEDFIHLHKKGTDAEQMEKLFGDTYWFYFFYRFNQ